VFRRFRPEIAIIVWCVWRLEKEASIVASSDGAERQIVKGLGRLVGHRLIDISAAPPAWDLTFKFSGGFHLKVFCDHAGKGASFSINWEARLRNQRVIAGAGTALEITDKE
jgi:hypothetical protein